MCTNDETSNEAFMDASVEEMLQEDTTLEENFDDEFDEIDDIVLQTDFSDAALNQDVEMPAEVSEYFITLELQTQKLKKELDECDELLLYLPHEPKGNRQAVVLYEDSRELDAAAAEHGLSVEEFKQKVLSDLDHEHFTEEDVIHEFEEFSRLQEELNEIRSSIRLGTSYEIKAILPHEDSTVEGSDNSDITKETTLALCNRDVGTDEDGSRTIVGYTIPNCADENFEVGRLISSTALSDTRDYVLEQLRITEQQHEVKVQTLTKSIEKCKQEEEVILLYQEERKKMLQKVHDKEETAMLERLKENERLVEEEQKVKTELTTQELNIVQAEIDQLSEALEKEKQLYEVSRRQAMELLDAARKHAAVQIQKVYRGYRARRKNSSTIEELKVWKKLKKEEKYQRRIMEVEYEIEYQKEQVQKEKERQDKEAAEMKMKQEKEERLKENEKKRKEEEDRIVEELRKEKERKNKEQRLMEEMRRKEEEELRKQAELRCKEEERLRKEEEKKRKNEEKKKEKEEEKQKKEERRKIKEVENMRKKVEKQIKEEEIKTKEEKNLLKEKDIALKGQEKQLTEDEVKIYMKEEISIKEERIIKENEEVKGTDKRNEEDMHGSNKVVIDKTRENNGLEENMNNKPMIVKQAGEKVTKDIKDKIKNVNEATKIGGAAIKGKFDLCKEDNLSTSDGVTDLLLQCEKSDLGSKDENPDIACADGKPDISCTDDRTVIPLVYNNTVSQQFSPASVSIKSGFSPLQSHLFSNAKRVDNGKSESTSVQLSSASVTSSASFQEAAGANLRSSESLVIHQQRLNWIKSCTPWSKVSCEPWKLKQTSQKSYKRPTRAKKLPPLSEAVILDRAHAGSLREVTSVTLASLPECSLSTLAQCWSLRYLTVTKCGLMCLEGLDQCRHLLYINAENNSIEYMDLKDLGSLQVVRLAHNSLSVIHGLDGCINLRSLDLSHNRITRISGLGSLRRIHSLNLSHNQLVSSDGLHEAITLQHLDLSHNYLQQVTNISKLCLLTDLTLACNNLLQVPELQNQVLLQTLYLQENSIKSLEPVSQYWLPLLQTLNCSQNMLDSVTGIGSLILLSHLDVSQNQITDMENLLPGITQNKRLEALKLEGNPLVDAYAQEYKQLVIRAVPSLKSLDYLPVQSQTAGSDVEGGAILCQDFIQMCLSQASLHTALKNEFHSQMKVLLANQHVTGETLCSTCFAFCDTSFKMASEHRSAHEYGDTSTTSEMSHSPVVTMDEKTKFHSITNFKPQPETMAGRKHIFNVFGSSNAPDKSVSDKDSVHNICDNMVHFVATLDSENHASNNQSAVINSSNSVIVKGHISSETKNEHSSLTHTNMQPDFHLSNSTNSTTRQSQSTINNMKSRPGATETYKTTSQLATVEFSPSEKSNNDRNNSHTNAISNPSAADSSIEGMNRLTLTGKKNLESSMTDNAKPASVKLQNHEQFGQYLSGKDKFEIALQAQSSGIKVLADAQTQNKASIYPSTNGSGHMLLSGVKADIVGGQLFKQDASDIYKDLELSAPDSAGNTDSMEFDIDTFLDMGELDELLELGWRPSDVPDIPQSVHPVLGKIKAADNHNVDVGKQKARGQGHMLPHPPNQPSQAWTNPPISTELKSSPLALGAASPITAPSPLSVASTAETLSRGSVRSKKEELSEEWGFKDSRTVDMMLARAKKMKYNSERRRKLDKLDPQQKLHLLKKLEEKYRIKTTRSPSAKVLPRKEYFKAREEEFNRQELEKQTEDSTRVHRMFEWLHTQVGDYHIPISGLNPGVSSGYFNQDNTSSRTNVMGHIHARKSSPLSDQHKTVQKDAQQVRRYSSGETQSGHSTILPPIHESSLPSSHKKDRISFRDMPVETSGGWGGGKKRGKVKS